MAGGVVSAFWDVLAILWGLLMLARMMTGGDWEFQAVMGMLCTVLSRLDAKR